MTDFKKINLELQGHVLQHLLTRVTPNDEKTVSSALNDAVTLYLRLADLQSAGGGLFFKDPEGNFRKVVLPFEKNGADQNVGRADNDEGTE